MDNFRISATGHSLNYLPHYVADDRGFFADENLNVSVTVPKPWDRVLDDIADGRAEAALGGIWVPSMHHGRGMRLVPFAQVSGRAPLALIGRAPDSKFALTQLSGRVVAVPGSNGASLGMFLQMMLCEAGIDPRAVDYIQNLDGKLLARCFAAGMADYLIIDLPSALAFEASGHGHVLTTFAVTGGDVPWSVYYSWGDWPSDRPDLRPGFVRALAHAMAWINTSSNADLEPLLAREFPSMAPVIRVKVLDIYRSRGMWQAPRVDSAAYDRWQRGIADAHLTAAPIPYEQLIDSGPTGRTSDGP